MIGVTDVADHSAARGHAAISDTITAVSRKPIAAMACVERKSAKRLTGTKRSGFFEGSCVKRPGAPSKMELGAAIALVGLDPANTRDEREIILAALDSDDLCEVIAENVGALYLLDPPYACVTLPD